jgi:hypothetical protein
MRRSVVAAGVVAVSVLSGVGVARAVPDAPPPKVSGATIAPPPAWFALGAREAWFAYTSYCWTDRSGAAACVDFLPPARRPDLPRVRAAVGQRLVIHLGFVPSKLSLSVLGEAGARRTWTLPRARLATWRIARLGIVLVEAKSSRGSAGYLVRLRPR